jgi:hypothetical protein
MGWTTSFTYVSMERFWHAENNGRTNETR